MKPDKPQLLAIGGSAGSLQVVLGLLTALRAGFPLPIILILHRNSVFESSLEELLGTRTDLPIKEVEEKEPILPGTLYLCPADYHVLVEKDYTFSLDYSERVQYSRPSIDVSFLSAANVYGRGLIGLLLSGGNADGAEGLQYIRERGGVTVVQDPSTADVPYMPQQAISLIR
jgi:two-component system chemotaxis response regulator CheB